MLAKNNGDPRQCAANLLKIHRGEVPFERIKGLGTAIIDTPSILVKQDIIADAEWIINTYEPRVSVESIDFNEVEARKGNFSIMANIKLREEETNE